LNFFDAQDTARRTTRRLVIVYILTTILIVISVTLIVGAALYFSGQGNYGQPSGSFFAQHAAILVATAIIATLIILGSSAVKTASLSSGGGRVAVEMGGSPVSPNDQDPLRRRLRNVVEEMAIASGMPVPEIYVLEHENGINAFAAGYAPGDAAVAVTRGALELLNRDELQGVIGHEFSHILNGDMRLNIRLMGLLYGIMVIGLAGRVILRGGHYGSLMSSRRGKGAPVILMIGLGLAILGGIGVFFARAIKAGVSRQREFLADASAVQFTRQSEGLSNALIKIGGLHANSHLQATDPEEVSHMLFSTGMKLSGMFATHPPLTDRIRALNPNFKASDYPVTDELARQTAGDEDARTAGIHGGVTTAVAGGAIGSLAESIPAMVGDPENEHVEFATGLRQSVPQLLYDAAHSQESAYLLTVALIMDGSGRHLERQMKLAEERLGPDRARLTKQLYDEIVECGPEYRLPLMEIAFPALKTRPEPQLNYLLELIGRMIDVDGEIDLYEYCFYRILVSNLGQALDPSRRQKNSRATREPVQRAAIELLRIVARHGHEGPAEQQRAFVAGTALFGDWGSKYSFAAKHDYSVAVLDTSLDMLLALNGDGKRMLLEAITAVVMSDKQLHVAEAELIRAICASLDCPLPPILIQQ